MLKSTEDVVKEVNKEEAKTERSLMKMVKSTEEAAEEVKEEADEGKRERSLMGMFKSKEEAKKEVEEEAKEAKTEESLIDKAKNYVAEKIANVPTPEASLVDVNFKKVSFDSADYLAKVNIKNPYSHSIPICEIDYTLKSIGSVIASGRIPDPGSIKASGDTLVDVPMKVPHSIIVTLVKDIATDWDIDYELELGLIIDLPVIGNITIPLSRKGEIKLPTLKELVFGAKEEEKDSKEKEKDSKEKDKDSDK
ncbi:desiccation protectant protein Lea14 [Rosa sericea]